MRIFADTHLASVDAKACHSKPSKKLQLRGRVAVAPVLHVAAQLNIRRVPVGQSVKGRYCARDNWSVR